MKNILERIVNTKLDIYVLITDCAFVCYMFLFHRNIWVHPVFGWVSVLLTEFAPVFGWVSVLLTEFAPVFGWVSVLLTEFAPVFGWVSVLLTEFAPVFGWVSVLIISYLATVRVFFLDWFTGSHFWSISHN